MYDVLCTSCGFMIKSVERDKLNNVSLHTHTSQQQTHSDLCTQGVPIKNVYISYCQQILLHMYTHLSNLNLANTIQLSAVV